jgi:hypothetical protein
MPRLRKIEVRTSDRGQVSFEYGTKQFTTHVNYVNKYSEFYIPLPDLFSEFRDHFEKDRDKYGYANKKGAIGFYASTELQVCDNFLKACREFYSAEKSEQKVILYRYEYKSPKNDSMKEGKYHRFFDCEKHSEIKFEFTTATKLTVGNSVKYINSSDTVLRGAETKQIAGSMSAWVEIPYTEEAEEFFKSIVTGMDGIMEKMSFFLSTKSKVIEVIESKQRLLS